MDLAIPETPYINVMSATKPLTACHDINIVYCGPIDSHEFIYAVIIIARKPTPKSQATCYLSTFMDMTKKNHKMFLNLI